MVAAFCRGASLASHKERFNLLPCKELRFWVVANFRTLS